MPLGSIHAIPIREGLFGSPPWLSGVIILGGRAMLSDMQPAYLFSSMAFAVGAGGFVLYNIA